MLQPTVMALLAQSPLHGYSLIRLLVDSPMMRGTHPDSTGLYRLLATLEEQGIVNHRLTSSDVGPSKRVYKLTREGRRCFKKWIDTLDRYQASIVELVDMMRAIDR
jgi:DNA-binding PadR family transcriptional regulator